MRFSRMHRNTSNAGSWSGFLTGGKSAAGRVPASSSVFGELFKHTTSADVDYRLLNYRDADKFEVDVMIENTGGQLVGVEVKASATVRESDLRGLKKLASLAGDPFTAGVLLYDGNETLPLGSNIWAAPFTHCGVRRTIG